MTFQLNSKLVLIHNKTYIFIDNHILNFLIQLEVGKKKNSIILLQVPTTSSAIEGTCLLPCPQNWQPQVLFSGRVIFSVWKGKGGDCFNCHKNHGPIKRHYPRPQSLGTLANPRYISQKSMLDGGKEWLLAICVARPYNIKWQFSTFIRRVLNLTLLRALSHAN